MDPRSTAEYDRQQADRIRSEERSESDPNARKDYERLAQDYDAEADSIETELEAESE